MNKTIVILAKVLNKTVIDYYIDNYRQYPIYIVSPSLDNGLEKSSNVFYMHDNEFLKREDYPIINKTDRPNWYYQQFLKYEIIKKLNCDLIHIIDGDSFLSDDLLFSNNVFYTRKIVEDNYLDFIRFLSKSETSMLKRNYITNQMCFNKSYLNEMLQSYVPAGKDWITYFCEILIENTSWWFSEYQLYADFILRFKGIKDRKIKVFRRFDLIKDDFKRGLKRYEVVAVESQHKTGLLRLYRAKLFYKLNLNLG